jgi:plastocyanin
LSLEDRASIGISKITLSLALVVVVGVAGIAIYETSIPSTPTATSQHSSESSSSSVPIAVKMSPDVPLIAPGQTQNYSSIEVSTMAGATVNGTLSVRAFPPRGISIVLNETSVSLANDPQSIPFRLKVDPGISPGEYKVQVEAGSASIPALNQTFAIEVVPVLVVIQGLAFHPQNITVPKGTSIWWINLDSNLGCCDPGNHNVVFLSGSNASSMILKRLDTWSYTFDAAANFGYECTIHPFMKGQITVTG